MKDSSFRWAAVPLTLVLIVASFYLMGFPRGPQFGPSKCGPIRGVPLADVEKLMSGPLMPALFVFGDSYVDTGNVMTSNPDLALFLPYGASAGDTLYSSGRASNGLLLPDYLSQLLGLSTVSMPYVEVNSSWYYGCNFAYGGARALLPVSDPRSLVSQTNNFSDFANSAKLYWKGQQRREAVAPFSLKYPQMHSFRQGLYLLNIGLNDIGHYFMEGGDTHDIIQVKTLVERLTKSIEAAIEALQVHGARHFLIANVINQGCAPALTTLDEGRCNVRLTEVAAQAGHSFEDLARKLQTTQKDTKILILDAWNATTTSASNPTPLGFLEPRMACCGGGGPSNTDILCVDENATVCENPHEHIYWDNGHLTTAFQLQLAREAFAGTGYVRPSNILQTFVLSQIQT